jgi:GTP cyclohydrolase II
MNIAHAGLKPELKIVAQATLPTQVGTFEMFVFHWGSEGNGDMPRDHVALVRGEVQGRRAVPVRVHSECMTSEVFSSLKCDCREQLHAAQARIAHVGMGVLLYLRQEGRGIGLPNKIRAYELQARGHDTVDANRLLGLPDDARDYSPAAAMLHALGVTSIDLLTNNPEKETALRRLGITVDQRSPLVVEANPVAAPYLEAKRARMGHMLPRDGGATEDLQAPDAPPPTQMPVS